MTWEDSLRPEAFIASKLGDGDGRDEDIIQAVVTDILKKSLTLADVVVWTQGIVAADLDVTSQALGVEYLSRIFIELRFRTLTQHSTDSMIQWFISRLSILDTPDAHPQYSATPGLDWVYKVFQFMIPATAIRFTATRIRQAILAIVDDAEKFFALPAKTRLLALTFLSEVVHLQPSIPEEIGDEFIEKSIAIGARERDPSNLIEWFSIMRFVIAMPTFAGSAFCLPAWEGLARYFPIKAPPTSPISTEDLKEALRACIADSDDLAEFSFPFLLEKIDDQATINVKADIIQTIDACVRSYGKATVELHALKIYDNLKYEVINVTDDSLAKNTVLVFSATVESLANGIQAENLDGSSLMRYVHALIRDFDSYLMDARTDFIHNSGQILSEVASASDLAFEMIMKQEMPRLLTAFNDATSYDNKKQILDVVVRLLEAPFRSFRTPSSRFIDSDGRNQFIRKLVGLTEIQEQCLRKFDQTFIALMATAVKKSDEITGDDLTKLAIQGYRAIIRAASILSEAEIGTIITELCSIIIDSHHPISVRVKAVDSLKDISRFHPSLMYTVGVAQLHAALGNSLKNRQIPTIKLLVLAIVKTASQIDCYHDVNETLMAEFQDALPNSGASATDDDYRILHIFLEGIMIGIEYRQNCCPQEVRSLDVSEFISLLEKLHRIFVGVTVDEQTKKQTIAIRPLHKIREKDPFVEEGMSSDKDLEILRMLGQLNAKVMRWLTHFEQSSILSEVIFLWSRSYTTMKAEDIVTTFFGDPTSLILSAGLLTGITGTVELESHWDLSKFSVRLMSVYYLESSLKPITQAAILDALALVVNKFKRIIISKNKSVDALNPIEYLQNALIDLDHPATAKTIDPAARKRIVQLATVFISATNCSGSPVTVKLLARLINMVRDHQEIAEGFQWIMEDTAVLRQQNHCVIHLLSASRPVQFCVPKLLRMYRDCAAVQTSVTDEATLAKANGTKKRMIVALLGLLSHVPLEYAFDYLDALLPIAINGLTNERLNSVQSQTCIKLLIYGIQHHPETLAEHFNPLIKALCNVIENLDKSRDHKTISKAIQCIKVLPASEALKSHINSDLRHQILSSLLTASGNPSRSVREESSSCRHFWLVSCVDNDE